MDSLSQMVLAEIIGKGLNLGRDIFHPVSLLSAGGRMLRAKRRASVT
jgi:hypothetical protein